MKKLMMVVLLTAVTMMAPLAASARPVGVFVGPRFVGPRVVVVPRYYVGPRIGIGWGTPYWGPSWYAPYWGPYAYNYAPATGSLKFDTHDKDAQVYVNGSYAGTVGQLKTMDLQPGSYDIEVRAPEGGNQFQQRVYIAAGETLHLNPNL